MKRLEVISAFYDLKEGVAREPGDSFVSDDERAEKLNNEKLVIIVESIEEQPKPKRAPIKKKE